MLNIGSDRIGGFAKVGDGLGFQLCSEQTVSCATGVQGTSEPWGRFGGGSTRNRALVGGSGNSVHVMQIAQSRINTSDYA